MSDIRLILVDDHAILREGLRAFLRYHPDIQVVGEAENGADAIELVRQLHPDVVLMDIAMPEVNGIEAARSIRASYPETYILILSQYDDKQYVLPLVQAGVSGYILKNALGDDLVQAIRTVARGELYFSSSVANVLAGEMREKKSDTPEELTSREHQILKLIVDGKTSGQIALALSISVNTVIWHRANLMSKLGVHSVAELVRYAWQNGLTGEES
jgi:two-component system, NarL family, response regulator LiaR